MDCLEGCSGGYGVYLVVVVGAMTRCRVGCWVRRAEGALGGEGGFGGEPDVFLTDTGTVPGSGRGAIGVKWGPDVY